MSQKQWLNLIQTFLERRLNDAPDEISRDLIKDLQDDVKYFIET